MRSCAPRAVRATPPLAFVHFIKNESEAALPVPTNEMLVISSQGDDDFEKTQIGSLVDRSNISVVPMVGGVASIKENMEADILFTNNAPPTIGD